MTARSDRKSSTNSLPERSSARTTAPSRRFRGRLGDRFAFNRRIDCTINRRGRSSCRGEVQHLRCRWRSRNRDRYRTRAKDKRLVIGIHAVGLSVAGPIIFIDVLTVNAQPETGSEPLTTTAPLTFCGLTITVLRTPVWPVNEI